MTIAAETKAQPKQGRLPDLIPLLHSAAEAAGTLREGAVAAMAAKVAPGGKLDAAALEREQRAAHGLAWIATYVEAIRQIASYAERMQSEGRFGEMEALLAQIGDGRISGAARRRRDDEPERDRAAARARRGGEGPRGVPDACGARAHRGHDAGDARPRGGADPRRARGRRLRRPRPRRDAGGHARGDAPLRRRRGHAACARVAPQGRICAAAAHRRHGVARRVRPHHAGGVRRARARQGGDVRRLRGAVARLYRRGLARHALGDRRGADPQWRHRRAEGGVAAQDRERRGAAHGGVHRAQYRLRSRLAHHARGARTAMSTASPGRRPGSRMPPAPTS